MLLFAGDPMERLGQLNPKGERTALLEGNTE